MLMTRLNKDDGNNDNISFNQHEITVSVPINLQCVNFLTSVLFVFYPPNSLGQLAEQNKWTWQTHSMVIKQCVQQSRHSNMCICWIALINHINMTVQSKSAPIWIKPTRAISKNYFRLSSYWCCEFTLTQLQGLVLGRPKPVFSRTVPKIRLKPTFYCQKLSKTVQNAQNCLKLQTDYKCAKLIVR